MPEENCKLDKTVVELQKKNTARFETYNRDSLQREARASECSLQRAREGTPPYPTCCYARYCFKFKRALLRGSAGREVDDLLVVGNDVTLV